MYLTRVIGGLSLKWKLAGILVGLALIPMMVFIYIADASAHDEQTLRTGRLLELRAETTIDKIERNFFERYGDVQAFAFNPMACGTSEEATAAANYYMKTYGLYDLMVIADADGKVIAVNTTDAKSKPLDTSALIGRSVKNEQWFQACIGGQVSDGTSFAQDLHEDKWVAEVYHSRGLVVSFAAPIRDKSGKVVRVWSNRVSWARTAEQIMKEVRDTFKGSETQLIGKSGVLLDDGDPKAVLSFNLKEAGLEAAQRATEGKAGFVLEQHKRRKVLQMNGYAASKGYGNYKGFGWGVLVRQDADEVMAAAAATRRELLTVAGISAVILLFVAIWLGIRITRPIQKIMLALREVAKGDLSQRAEAKGHDEIGQMTEAFNATVRGIQTAVQQEKVDWEKIGQQRQDMARTQAMLDSASLNVMFADREFKIRYANTATLNTLKKFEHLLPIKADQILGQSIDIFHKRPEHPRRIVSDPKNLPYTATIVLGPETLELNITPVFDQDRKYLGAMVTWNVITEKLALEKQVKENAERDAAQAAELRRKVDAILGTVNAMSVGDFTQQIPDLGDDVVGKMAAALNQAITTVRETLEGVREVSEQLADASGQLASASEEIATGAQQQASSLEETASTLEEITATVKQNSDSAQQARQLASGSKDVAEKGGQVVGNAVEAMSEINQSSKKIAEIITAIDEIAFQTNLLALNAAVEAARAGEQGRGFAVVAAEVRNLAQRSATAAKEIKALIQDSVKKVEAGSELVNRSGATLTEIVTSVKRVTDIVTEIAAASREQSTGIDQVNKAVTQMDTVTQRNASQTEEMSATAQTLTDQAGQLRELVSRFKLSPEAGSASVHQTYVGAKKDRSRPTITATKLPPARAQAMKNGHAHELDRLGSAKTDDGFTEF